MKKYKVKIIGAGSIGNHLAHASRTLGFDVVMCDTDNNALDRTKNLIYPSRYGAWDEKISLHNVKDVPNGNFDIIFIGTPPSSHLKIASKSLLEKPKAIVIEKPVTTPDLKQIINFENQRKLFKDISIFVGYDHVVGKASKFVSHIIKENKIKKIISLEVKIREHWGGIFKAHSWLSGPEESYLGLWKQGGGAISEHSHGINIWQHFANELNLGLISKVSSVINYHKNRNLNYDEIGLINVKTTNGFIGKITQDVLTSPSEKKASIFFKQGFIEWYCNYDKNSDAVFWKINGNKKKKIFKKKRPDDFIEEIKHICKSFENKTKSPIDIENGYNTMLVIAAAHLSNAKNKYVNINYNKRFSKKAFIC